MAKTIEFCKCCHRKAAAKKGKCLACYKSGGVTVTYEGRVCATPGCGQDTWDMDSKFCPACREAKRIASLEAKAAQTATKAAA